MLNSLWLNTAYPRKTYPTLTEDVSCEVCIIGGGLSGLASAYRLAKEGKNVILVEKETIVGGATGHSTGKITVQHDLIYAQLMKKIGFDQTRLYYELNQEAIEFAQSIAPDDAFKNVDSILYAQTVEGSEKLKEEKRAYDQLGIANEFGLNSEIPIALDATLTITQQGQLHPVRFGQLLARLAERAGAQIYEYAEVRAIDVQQKMVHLQTAHRIHFEQLIICSHYPIESIRGLQLLKLRINRSYIVATNALIPLQGQYLSVDQPKRSIRTATIDGKHYFIFAGENHLAGTKEETGYYYEQLLSEVEDVFHLDEPAYQWSAQDPVTMDLLPHAGPISPDLPFIHIMTGYRKWGLSNSLVSANIVSDLIVGRPHKGTALYAPNRVKLGTFLLKALVNSGFLIKEFAGGHLTRMHAPICTHLGCRTRWNQADETWDCSCHGSRFRKDGSVLEGPATKPLDLS